LDSIQTSKCLNYIDAPFVGPYFFVFMCVWAYLRHYLNLKIIWSILTTFKTVGPYELNWDTQQYKCWISQYISFALMASLQAINLFWFFLICRIAVRFIVAGDAEDDRSEYEPSEEETEQREKELKEEFNGTASGAQGLLSEATSNEYSALGDGLKKRNGVAVS
jgi:acyl-CoA-dependent ceramide synthase